MKDSGSPTLEQVAALAGVSRATVSRVVNGSPKVLPDTVAAVERAIGQLGYVPNRAARALVTRRTDSVAIVVPEPDSRVFSDPFFAGILRGVSMTLAPTSSQLVLLIEPAEGDDQRLLRYLRGGHVDGAIIVSHHGRDNVLQELALLPLPIVFSARPLGRRRTGRECGRRQRRGCADGGGVPAVIGRRKIGTIAGPLDMTAGLDRLTGYKDVTQEAGLPEAVAFGDFTADGGEQAALRLFDEYPDLDGLFVANDLMATTPSAGAVAARPAGAGRRRGGRFRRLGAGDDHDAEADHGAPAGREARRPAGRDPARQDRRRGTRPARRSSAPN